MKHRKLAIGIALGALLPGAAFAQASSIGDSNRPPVDNQARDTSAQDVQERAKQEGAVKPAKARKTKGPVPATAADVVVGSEIHDKKGVAVGKVDSIEADGVIVATAGGRVKVPLEAFGKDTKGLVFGVTKAEFDQMVSGAGNTPAG